MDELIKTLRRAVAVQAVLAAGDDRDRAALAELIAGEASDSHARFMYARLDVIAVRLFG